MNPHNINPDIVVQFGANHDVLFPEEISDKVPLTLKVLAMIWAILSLSGSILLSIPRRYTVLDVSSNSEMRNEDSSSYSIRSISTKDESMLENELIEDPAVLSSN